VPGADRTTAQCSLPPVLQSLACAWRFPARQFPEL